MTRPLSAFALLLAAAPLAATPPPGVRVDHDFNRLPLPASGYQAYLIGEYHGVKEMGDVLVSYLARLHRDAGVRDVALEEDAVYGPAAQDYVSGRSDTLPDDLCLRAGMLRGLREFNRTHTDSEQVRVHLVDVDSPESAIRNHMLSIQGRIPGASAVAMPQDDAIAADGPASVEELMRRTEDASLRGALRTVHRSILALQQGFRVGTGPPQGSVYLDARESAIADNIRDIASQGRPVLALYGADHVSKKSRKDGGPRRDSAFAPLAMRLEQAGLKVFSVVVFPLSGASRWRGSESRFVWDARDGWLAGGDTFDRILASVPDATLLYVDATRQRAELPSRDISKYGVDAFLLLGAGTPMENHCPRLSDGSIPKR